MSRMLTDNNGREIIRLDNNADEYTLGSLDWQGITWDYPENVRNTQELAKPNPLTLEVFAREYTLILEHLGRKKPSDPLLRKYFDILSAQLTEKRFLSACEAVYTTEKLYPSDLVAFLANYHKNTRETNSAAYQAYEPVVLDDLSVSTVKLEPKQGTNQRKSELWKQAREVNDA